jgi:hypothetical protein
MTSKQQEKIINAFYLKQKMDNVSITISIHHHYPKVYDSINLAIIHNIPEYLYDHILLS